MSVRLRFDRFELQLDERRLLADGHVAPLRGHAFSLLAALVERPGHLITKAELLQRVWGTVIVEDNALQAHISALRKVLGAPAIATVPGQGYRFALDVRPVPPADTAVPGPAHNLPQPMTSFIGREREIAEIRRWLGMTRLLTLTGTGGCGKTRLALEVAGDLMDRYLDGIWLVELAPLAEPTLVAQAVAKALAIEAKPGQDTVETLLAWLGARRVLLVLDNAEHLLEACALLADLLLRRCAGLAILATSREQLGVDGELIYRVPPLSVPAGDAGEDVLGCEAVRLFIDRAHLQRPDFDISANSANDAAALASICRRLDGIALAIELAAAQLRMMSLDALSLRLDDRFRVLGSGARTAMPRHQTLRALIDWSHGLLSGPEKALLRRVSVFAGGWTLEAAEQVCAGTGVERDQVWALLIALTDKSLVITDTGGEPTRFDMLETIRHYAQDKLAEAGEQDPLRERHLGHFVRMAGDLDAARSDAHLQQTMDRLEAEHDNLRAALAWCESGSSHALDGLRLAASLDWFWWFRGHFGEGQSWLERLLSKVPPGERSEVVAAALHTSGALASKDDQGAARLEQAIVLWRELGNPRQLARSIGVLADLQQSNGETSAARANYAEVLSIARALGQSRSVVNALVGLARAERASGAYAAAEALLLEALPVSRTVGPGLEGMVHQILASLRHVRGDLAAAHGMLLDAIEKLREFGDLWNVGYSHLLLAQVCQDMNDLSAARTHLQLGLGWNVHGVSTQRDWLVAVAGVVSDLAEPTCAARLWGCLQRHDETASSAWRSWTRPRERGLQDRARRALLDDTAFDKAWQEGRSWSLDEAFDYARSLL